jgi:hypothetical protein
VTRIVRGNRLIPPRGSTVLQSGDHDEISKKQINDAEEATPPILGVMRLTATSTAWT